MTTVKKSVLVPYTAAQMFELVNRIEDYPHFLPWCLGTTVHSRNEDEVRASIMVGKSGIKHSFTTINRLQKNKLIEVRLVEGPFRYLEGFWSFENSGEQKCQVKLDLEFEFSNKLVSLTVTPLLQKITDTFVTVFCARAQEIYGKP